MLLHLQQFLSSRSPPACEWEAANAGQRNFTMRWIPVTVERMGFFMKKTSRYALAGILLSDVCAKANPIFTKLLYRNNWTALSIYFLALVFIVILLALHEFMQSERGHRWDIGREDVKGILLTTLTGGVLSPLLFMIGLQYVQASDAILINGLLPFFIVIFAVLFLREHFTAQMVLGGMFLVSGTVVLLWRDMLSAHLNMGVPLLVLAALIGAFTTTLHKRYIKHRHLDSIVLIRSVLSLLVVTLLMMILEPQSFELLLHPPDIWTVLGLSAVAFIIPYFLYFRSLKHIQTVDAGIVLTAGPAIGLLLTNIFLGEQIQPEQFMSLLLVATGIFFINVPVSKLRIVPSRLMALGPLRR